MGKFIKHTATGVLIGLWTLACAAEEVVQVPTEGLGEQVQSIKREVLRISSELDQLQKKLMYPSDTQVALFLSLDPKDKFRLDDIAIQIDGKDVAYYVYSPKELEALQNGGVQRIYTGNISGGTHTLGVETAGKATDNSNFKHSASHKFYKMKGPKVIEIILSGAGSKIESVAD